MNHVTKQILFGAVLILMSALGYLIHYLLFRDLHHILIYLVGDIAFVFIEVLLVTLIIHKLLEWREMQNRLEKLNSVIGVFFSEIGTELLSYFSDLDANLDTIRNDLLVSLQWTDKEFQEVTRCLNAYAYQVEPVKLDFEKLNLFLLGKRDFLLILMGNPNLMEHELFTELLRAVFHLAEELKLRNTISDLPATDRRHIAGDINRVYGLLVREWISYVKHLKNNFPYMFSLAMRTNPFDQTASVIVK
ncbi:MAG: hypothetical protein ABFD70_14010 [Syntrophaceae bacterium]